MTSLYQLTAQHSQIMQHLESLDLDHATIADTIEASGITEDIQTKCESVAMYRENQMMIANAKKAAAKRLSEEAKAIEVKANKMIDYLDASMMKIGVSEISCEYFTIKYKKNPPSIDIVDQDLIPKQFIKTKITESVDKNGLKAAFKELEEGETIKGVKLVTGKKRLVIE